MARKLKNILLSARLKREDNHRFVRKVKIFFSSHISRQICTIFKKINNVDMLFFVLLGLRRVKSALDVFHEDQGFRYQLTSIILGRYCSASARSDGWIGLHPHTFG